MQRIQQTPKTLNNRWDNAARLAAVPAPNAAKFAVAVVPMFSPIIRAIPRYMGNTPVEHSRIVIAITAADDCTIHVMMVPAARKTSMVV